MGPRTRRILGTLAVGVAAAVPALLPLLRGRVFAFRDLIGFFLPMKVFLHGRLLAGELPLWDPWTYCGRPFLANLQSEVLYLPNTLACLLPMPWGFGLFAAFHLAAGALGAAAWARSWGVRRPLAAVAGLAYGAGGPLVASIELSNNLATMAWWPWIGWAASRLAANGKPRFFLALVGTLLGAGLGGEPHLAAAAGLLALAAGLLAPAASPGKRPPPPVRRAGMVLLAGGAALGLLLVQLLPLVELVRLSDRAGGLTLAESARHSAAPAQAIGYLLADRHAYLPGGPAGSGPEPYLRLLYAGAVPLGAAALGLWSLRRGEYRRPAALAAGILAVSWVLALGGSTPVFPLVHRLGLLPGFRYPAKFLVPASLGLALLAAIGLEKILDSRSAGRRAGAALLAWPASAGLLAWFLTGRTAFLHVVLGAVAGAAALVFLQPRLAGLAATFIVAADLLAAHVGILPTMPAAALYAPTGASRLAGREDRVLPRPTTREQLLAAWDPSSPDPWPSYARARVRMMVDNVPEALQTASARGAAALVPRRIGEVLEAADRGPAGLPFVRAMAAGILVSHTPLRAPGLVLAGGRGPFLFRVEDALPRAYLARSWAVEDGPVERVANEDVASGRVVLLDREPDMEPAEPEAAGPAGTFWVVPGASGTGRSTWHLQAPRPALLVLVESWYPGWTAEVDGHPEPVLRANYAFRAVAVPAGEHTVTMRFEPATVRIGVAGSLVALLLLGLLPGVEKMARSSQTSSSAPF